jgi:hypothetical protein
MTRNQLLPKYPRSASSGVMFTVGGGGDVSPVASTTVNRGDTIVFHKDPSLIASITHVCAQYNDVCQCATVFNGVSSGAHLALCGDDSEYTISMNATIGADYELYGATDEGPVAGATNGNIHVGG